MLRFLMPQTVDIHSVCATIVENHTPVATHGQAVVLAKLSHSPELNGAKPILVRLRVRIKTFKTSLITSIYPWHSFCNQFD
jgi:hypothetical protein